jgi:hypothetical protein
MRERALPEVALRVGSGFARVELRSGSASPGFALRAGSRNALVRAATRDEVRDRPGLSDLDGAVAGDEHRVVAIDVPGPAMDAARILACDDAERVHAKAIGLPPERDASVNPNPVHARVDAGLESAGFLDRAGIDERKAIERQGITHHGLAPHEGRRAPFEMAGPSERPPRLSLSGG